MKHITHYISLIAIFTAGLLGFYFFPHDKMFLTSVSVALFSSYISWGIIHHVIHKDICFTVIMEYVTISLLGLIMVLGLLFRA